jgi:nitroreductase/uncharacterized protein YndB with AHSA1/START domain
MDLDPTMIDTAMIDHALMTTRSVRARLDLERDVPDQVILDCIDVAEQAPTGGNQGSRRWMVIRDQATKDAMAELYLKAGGSWVIESAKKLEGTDHHSAKMMQGARRLAENIAQVPALVIPTIIGRHDGSGRPGLFDSVIQAAWSFQVALRARGLGSTWTTMYLAEADAVAELLHLPDNVTQIALFPVAYTIGTDFRPAKRYPARDITYFDRYGFTLEGDRSEPRTMANGPGVTAEIDIAAEPAAVWAAVTDLANHSRWSDELKIAVWDSSDDPGVGSTFTGQNGNERIGEWQVTCTVTHWEPKRSFGWLVGTDAASAAARWRFDIEPIPGRQSRLRYHVDLGPGPSGLTGLIAENPDAEPLFIAGRQEMLRTNMAATIAGIGDELTSGSGA